MKETKRIIRGLRKNKNLKQSEIADFLKISQQTYSSYEIGRNGIPLNIVMSLADFYNVSTDFLLGRTTYEQGVMNLNKLIIADYSVGQLISDVLSLDNNGRKYVVECIGLQKLKAKNKNI